MERSTIHPRSLCVLSSLSALSISAFHDLGACCEGGFGTAAVRTKHEARVSTKEGIYTADCSNAPARRAVAMMGASCLKQASCPHIRPVPRMWCGGLKRKCKRATLRRSGTKTVTCHYYPRCGSDKPTPRPASPSCTSMRELGGFRQAPASCTSSWPTAPTPPAAPVAPTL